MRTFSEYRHILQLWQAGMNKCQIAQTTGIPRATVRDCIKRYGSLAAYESFIEQDAQIELPEKLRQSAYTEIQKAYGYVFGLYLGDGSLTKVRNVHRLRITLDARYPAIISRCAAEIQSLLPDNRIGITRRYYRGRVSCVDVSAFYKYWTDVFPQHGSGKKHIRSIKLEGWQTEIITAYPLEFFRGLYHSDGSRFSNIVNGIDYPRYQFTNQSADIRALYCQTCDRLGLHWTAKKRHITDLLPTDIYISRRKDVMFLDQVVGAKA